MRSRKISSVTDRHVQTVAESWLSEALPFKDSGWKCTARVLWGLVLVAAARMSSLFAACRDLSEAPTDQALRDGLRKNLPKRTRTLEAKLDAALCGHLPKALARRARNVAIDWHLIPYHGRPRRSKNELYHSLPKSGTTKFHAYGTACVIEHGHRYTLAATWIQGNESVVDVLTRLLDRIAARGVRIKGLYLDRQFFSTPVISLLQSRGIPFLMPVMFRGRKSRKRRAGKRGSRKGAAQRRTRKTSRKQTSGKRKSSRPQKLRDFLRSPAGRHRFTWTVNGTSVSFHVVVAYKSYEHHRTGKRRKKKLLYAAWKVAGAPVEIREAYRTRFGIESSYRQLGAARIRTCTTDPLLRLFFVLVSLVLRNVWVWLHDTYFAEHRGSRRILHPEALRYEQMLRWIEAVLVARLNTNADQHVELPP